MSKKKLRMIFAVVIVLLIGVMIFFIADIELSSADATNDQRCPEGYGYSTGYGGGPICIKYSRSGDLGPFGVDIVPVNDQRD